MQETFITLAVIAAHFTAAAQVATSPVAGLNVSGYNVVNFDNEVKMRLGPCIGALIDLPSKNKWSFQTGLLYKLNGYGAPVTFSYSYPLGDIVRTRVSTLDVPVRLTYSFAEVGRSTFFIGAGPYVAINIAASSHVDDRKYDNPVKKIEIGGDKSTQRMDAGGGINIGYRAAKGLLLCVQGQYGFLISDKAINGHNYNFGVVGGYSFKMKKDKAPTEVPQQK